MKYSQSPRAKPEGPPNGPVDMVDIGVLNFNIIMFSNRECEITVLALNNNWANLKGPFNIRRNNC